MNPLLFSNNKVSLNSAKELAERNLDASPGAFTLNNSAKRGVDHKSIAARVIFGSKILDNEEFEVC
jgi:hypothetical protein